MELTSPPVLATANMISGAMAQMGQTFPIYDISSGIPVTSFPCVVLEQITDTEFGKYTVTGKQEIIVSDLIRSGEDENVTVARHANFVYSLQYALQTMPNMPGYHIAYKISLKEEVLIDGRTFVNGTGLVSAKIQIAWGLQE